MHLADTYILMFVLQLFLRPLDGIAETEVDGETLDDALCRINIDINSLPKFTNFYHGNILLCLLSNSRNRGICFND